MKILPVNNYQINDNRKNGVSFKGIDFPPIRVLKNVFGPNANMADYIWLATSRQSLKEEIKFFNPYLKKIQQTQNEVGQLLARDKTEENLSAVFNKVKELLSSLPDKTREKICYNADKNYRESLTELGFKEDEIRSPKNIKILGSQLALSELKNYTKTNLTSFLDSWKELINPQVKMEHVIIKDGPTPNSFIIKGGWPQNQSEVVITRNK